MDEKLNEQNQRHFNWRRIHHSVGFWIFLFLMMIAITYYIITVDFAFAPHQPVKQLPEKHIQF